MTLKKYLLTNTHTFLYNLFLPFPRVDFTNFNSYFKQHFTDFIRKSPVTRSFFHFTTIILKKSKEKKTLLRAGFKTLLLLCHTHTPARAALVVRLI